MQIQPVCTLLVYTHTVENTFRKEKNKSHTLATTTDLTYSFSKIFKLSHSVESLQSGSSACIDLLGGPEQSYTHMPQSVNVFCCSGRGCGLFTPLFVARKSVVFGGLTYLLTHTLPNNTSSFPKNYRCKNSCVFVALLRKSI